MATRKRGTSEPAPAIPSEIPAGPPICMKTLLPGLRARHDGWTQERVQKFLDALAHTGCVMDAARVAGMSDVGARRLYARFPAFAKAWDAALAKAQKGLVAIAYQRAVEGKETIIYRRGEEYERRISPSDAMLGLLVKRGDLTGEGAGLKPEQVITHEEQRQGWHFDHNGKKRKGRSGAEIAHGVEAKLRDMHMRILLKELDTNCCRMCGVQMPDAQRAKIEAELNRDYPVDAASGRRRWVKG